MLRKHMKIATVLGARPQFIKAAVVSRAFNSSPDIEELIIHTGQHYDENMSEVFFRELDIPMPIFNLDIGSAPHGRQSGRMLEAVEGVLMQEAPDWVLVYGDTNSTLAGALSAVKLHIPVAHVEAGLRSFDRRMPEEVNRVVADHTADLLFAPTTSAVRNLRREGLPDSSIHQVGDVMYDAAIYYGSRAEAHSQVLNRLGLETKGYVLTTIHRAENTENRQRLRVIFDAIEDVASEMPVVLPIHPRTRKILNDTGMLDRISRFIRLIDPVGFLDMMMLEKNARLIATDSGGVQKEAYFHRVPCVTFRETTEWVELLELGWNRLAPPLSTATVISGLRSGLESTPSSMQTPYGDGHAAKRIVQILLSGARARADYVDVRDATVAPLSPEQALDAQNKF